MAKKRGKSKFSVKGIKVHKLAHFAFLIGILIAILAGILRSYFDIGPETLVTTLVLLGFIVGLFNLTAKETMPFLVAAIALMLAGIVNLNLFNLYGLWPQLGPILRNVLSNIVVFVVPGAIILGLKTIWQLASD